MLRLLLLLLLLLLLRRRYVEKKEEADEEVHHYTLSARRRCVMLLLFLHVALLLIIEYLLEYLSTRFYLRNNILCFSSCFRRTSRVVFQSVTWRESSFPSIGLLGADRLSGARCATEKSRDGDHFAHGATQRVDGARDIYD